MKSKMNKKPDTSLVFATRSGLMQIPAYPLQFAKALIQIGYEPLPPFRSRNLFGNTVYYYPNVFKYMRYIYSVEGATGLFRGVGMRVASHVVATLGHNKVLEYFDDEQNDDDLRSEKQTQVEKTKNEDDVEAFIKLTSKDLAARCFAITISHPLHVMAFRCMAQFVGGEDIYSSWNVIQNTTQIYKGEGILGFFGGLVPRLCFEVSAIIITNTCTYLFRIYVSRDKEITFISELASAMLASSIAYPLSVVSTVSAISGSDLVAARPPKMPLYSNWIEILKDLYESNQLKRGTSSFYRRYLPAFMDANAMMNGYKLA